MKKENIEILDNMAMELDARTAIKEELIDILNDKDFLYYQGMYSGYLNAMFILNYITASDLNSLIAELPD